MSLAAMNYLREKLKAENILTDEPLSLHTSFKVGGPAKCYAFVEDEDLLADIISYFYKIEQPYFIIGNGSNLLVSDKGYDGIVIKLSGKLCSVEADGDRIICGAGALLSQAAHLAMENSLTGLEFASGIPGSIGGGVIMNAGAYDGDMSMVVDSVNVINRTGEKMVLFRDSLDFKYRQSAIKGRGYIVTKVNLSLKPGEKDSIKSRMDELSALRRSKQPLEYPSAGSTFKRPEGHFAGKLIMDAGLSGFTVGGAQISEKHCGFVINKGSATASDIKKVMDEAARKVSDTFHVRLEPEVILIGEF